MNIADRILLTIYSSIVGVISLFLVFVPFSKAAYNWTSYGINTIRNTWQNIIIPLFFLAISIRFLISGIRMRKGRSQTVVRHTTFGEVNISLSAIEGMAQKSARVVPGLRDIKAVAQQVDDGVIIHITALALSDMNIPESSIKAQQSIKEYIEECTGISVKEIKVRINDLANQKGRVE